MSRRGRAAPSNACLRSADMTRTSCTVGPVDSHSQAPVVVVGSGAAGLACALALAPVPVLLVTKTESLAGGSSLLSQGGIAAALDPSDSPSRHARDTLRAAAGLADPDRVEELTQDGPDAMRWLIAAGFAADRSADGRIKLGREGAHSRARIIHAGGDATGRALVSALSAQVARTPSIKILPATVALDLLFDSGRVVGLSAYQAGGGWIALMSRAVVLATGGLGALWMETTNPAEATGDGLAMAARAGAALADLEFMQFHPTALLPRGSADGSPLALLTEALRGAGARLLDQAGVSFMSDEHPLGDLAPRDIVARAIWRRRASGDGVFLDLRPALAGQGTDAFPQAVALCRAAGFEPTETPVPIAPAAHYHMGGVATDDRGRSSIPGLWACGEVAHTGVHGANRLASNSLLEALVWARRTAVALRQEIDGRPQPRPAPVVARPIVPSSRRATPETVRARVRTLMSRHVGILRDRMA